MSKIKRETQIQLPVSDWDIEHFDWTKEMYQKHKEDLQQIYKEYMAMRVKYNDDACMARWRWIEDKCGLKVIYNPHSHIEIMAKDEYKRYTNMFELFNSWLSFKEHLENTPDSWYKKFNDIKNSTPKVNFNIPQDIIESAKRDMQYKTMKQDILDSFN